MDPSLAVWVHDVDPSIAPGLPALLGERARIDPAGTIYFKIGPLDTDWSLSPGSGGVPSAPGDAQYWVSTSNATLTAEVNMGALTAGTLQQTVTLGVATPTAFLGTTSYIPFYAAGSQLTEHSSLTFNAAGGHLLLGNDLYFTRAGNSSLDKQGSGTMFIGTSVAGGSLFFYTNAGATTAATVVMDSTGKITAGGASGFVFNPVDNSVVIGTALPVAGVAMEVVKDVNQGTVLCFVNPNTGGAAYTNFILGQQSQLVSGATFGMALFGSGSTYGSPYGPNVAILSVDSGTGNMHFWIDQNVGDFVWFTKATFPNPPERMKLTTAGVLSVNDLGAAGTGRLVKAALTTGILSIATAAEVATAITWPTANQVLFSSGTTTAPIGEAGFTFIPGDNLLAIGAGYAQGWFNLGNDGSGTFEEVAAFWSSNVFNLKSLTSGGTVRSMSINADTATLTLTGSGTFLVAGVVGTHPSFSTGSTGLSLDAPVSVVSAAGATLDAIRVLGSAISVTGSTNITTALGFNYVKVSAPTLTGTGGAKTITTASTMVLTGAPTAAGDVTITLPMTFWVQGGRSRFDGHFTGAGSGSDLGFFGSNGVAQQTSGANLTNNVTAGGTDDTITNWTDLSTYGTDAEAIRNAVYQLARKLKQINDGLRSYNMFT